MAHCIKIETREEIPEFCYKAGETFAESQPSGHLAEILERSAVVWTWKEALVDEYGAFRIWRTSYYVPAPD